MLFKRHATDLFYCICFFVSFLYLIWENLQSCESLLFLLLDALGWKILSIKDYRVNPTWTKSLPGCPTVVNRGQWELETSGIRREQRWSGQDEGAWVEKAVLRLAERLPQQIKTKLAQKKKRTENSLLLWKLRRQMTDYALAVPRIWPCILLWPPALPSSPQGWTKRLCFGHNRYFQKRDAPGKRWRTFFIATESGFYSPSTSANC